MLIKKFLSLGVISAALFAANLSAEAASISSQADLTATSPNYFVLLGGGWSFSRAARISADPQYWDTSPQGYNTRMGNSALYTVGFGVQLNPLLSLDIEGTTRPSYEYKKFQTSTTAATPGFAGTKTRYFDFSSNSIMLNAYLHGQGISDKLLIHLCPVATWEPIVGAGAGIAYNKVKDFHSDAYITSGGANAVSMMNDNTTTSFAWQAMAGFEVSYQQKFDVDVGYRYFDGGNFRTNNYVTSLPTDNVVTPWRGKFAANEIFLNLKFNFS